MIIVLVGSPLAGKTTLLNKLKEKGVKVFHSDSFVNQIYKKDNKKLIMQKIKRKGERSETEEAAEL